MGRSQEEEEGTLAKRVGDPGGGGRRPPGRRVRPGLQGPCDCAVVLSSNLS